MGAVAVMMASCDLDMTPESTMTDAAYWKSETDLRGACNRFYEQLNGNNDLGGGFSHDYRSDELNNNGGANSTSAGSWTIPSTNGSWTDAYWRIFIANNILEKSVRANVTEDVLNRYQAEARFFRAFYYFELVKKYGDVPLLLKAINNTTDPALEMPRTPREEVMQQVYEDLEFAAQWLPDIDSKEITGHWGHVAKQAATAMIVRAGLYEGTFGKYHNLAGCDYKAHLKKSIDAAESLMNSGKFELYPDFEKLFQVDAEGRGNKENRVLDMHDIFNLLYVDATATDHAYAFAAGQMEYAMKCADKARKEEKNAARRRVEPRTVNKDGSLAMVHPHDWCSGFFPGSLWQMYAYTHSDFWRQSAISWTWPIEEAKWHRGTHDLGFMMYDSFGKAYDLTGERSYRDVAVNHANTTMKNHFRKDYSSYHVVDYDPETGEVRMKCPHQGNADDSFWSRGQGWGLYGFAMCYRFTRDEAYLKQSENIADFFLSLPNMPADGVPYWDMKLDAISQCTPENINPDVPRDASAAIRTRSR